MNKQSESNRMNKVFILVIKEYLQSQSQQLSHSIKSSIFFMQSEETFIPKKFLIVNEFNRAAVQCRINVPYIPASRQINISRALTEIHTTKVNISDSHIFYFDQFRAMNVFIGQYPFHQEIFLPNQLFAEDNVQIHYRKLVSESMCSEKPCQPEQKKKKVKERTIKEAIDAVKQWRQLYEETDLKGKRVYTLESAAQKVGYAKKTLDDYFNQLRLAQYYNFDFNRHQFDKIGVLRRFVKACQKKETETCTMMLDEDIQSQKMMDQDDINKYFKDPSSSDDEDFNF